MSKGHVDEEARAILIRAGEDAAKRGLKIVSYEITGFPGQARTFRYGYARLKPPRGSRAAPEPPRSRRGVAVDGAPQGSLL